MPGEKVTAAKGTRPMSRADTGTADPTEAVTRVRTVDFGPTPETSPLAAAWSLLRPIVDAFRRDYRHRGYIEYAPAQLISRVDPSVRFIGSTISVLKPLLSDSTVPDPGVVLVQPAVRTRNLAKLLDEDAKLTAPSFFLHMGTLSPPGTLDAAASYAWTFLNKQVSARGGARVVMRISSEDPDLMRIARRLPDPVIETDGEDPSCYRHRFGMSGIGGRNLNYAIRHADGRMFNFGNLVVIEDAQGCCGIETAVGLNHFVAAIFGLDHPIVASPVAAVVSITSCSEIKFADALVASATFADAGLTPTGRGRGRTFRGYLAALAALRRPCGIPIDDLERAVAYLVTGPEGRTIASSIRHHVEALDCSRPPGADGDE